MWFLSRLLFLWVLLLFDILILLLLFLQLVSLCVDVVPRSSSSVVADSIRHSYIPCSVSSVSFVAC